MDRGKDERWSGGRFMRFEARRLWREVRGDWPVNRRSSRKAPCHHCRECKGCAQWSQTRLSRARVRDRRIQCPSQIDANMGMRRLPALSFSLMIEDDRKSMSLYKGRSLLKSIPAGDIRVAPKVRALEDPSVLHSCLPLNTQLI